MHRGTRSPLFCLDTARVRQRFAEVCACFPGTDVPRRPRLIFGPDGVMSLCRQDVLRNMVVPCEENPLPVEEVEIDEFQFHYTTSEKPHIQNVRRAAMTGAVPDDSWTGGRY